MVGGEAERGHCQPENRAVVDSTFRTALGTPRLMEPLSGDPHSSMQEASMRYSRPLQRSEAK